MQTKAIIHSCFSVLATTRKQMALLLEVDKFYFKTPLPFFYRIIKYRYEFGCVLIKALVSTGYADCKSNKHGPRARTHILTDN